MAQFGGGRGSGSGHHRGSGSGGTGGSGMAMGGSGGGKAKDPDRKMLFKLVEGKPKMVFVKLGLTDGSTTQLLEGEVDTGDQLITEVQGLPAQQRKVGAF
jgi:HlyD family secretion protein